MGLEDRDYMRERRRQAVQGRQPEPSRSIWAQPPIFWLIMIPCMFATQLLIAYLRAHYTPRPVAVAAPTSAPHPNPLTPSTVGGSSPPGFILPDAQQFPANGTVEWFIHVRTDQLLNRLRIHDQTGTARYKVIRIRENGTNRVIAQTYLHPGGTSAILLPVGPYGFTIAMGSSWYGHEAHFGPSGYYGRGLTMMINPPDVTALHNYGILPPASGGQEMSPLPGSAF